MSKACGALSHPSSISYRIEQNHPDWSSRFLAGRELHIASLHRTGFIGMNFFLALLGFAGMIFTAYAFLRNKSPGTILSYFHSRRQRDPSSLTPPQSPSTEKPALPSNEKTNAEWRDTFPPACRHALAGVKLFGPGPSADDLSKQPADYSELVSCTETPDAEKMSTHVTATGFTVEEIRRLGDFPDYAKLSGVPLPQNYLGFDLHKAVPRPYRPLRWAYHQTMCKLCEKHFLSRLLLS
nr:hypothetical protein CFP56_07597 [Quercus suber]